jgi:hypothetical protein
MTDRFKALGTLALCVLVAFGLSWVLSPWADVVALVLVIAMAPFATLFALAYMLTRPWWTTAIGRAILVSSLSLALLIDISLLYQWLGDDYYFRDAVRLTVFQLILGGILYKCRALFLPNVGRRRSNTDDRL